jgi:hypothetical protein
MLESQKSQLTCSYCSRIYKDPIKLPCGDSICREHLSQRDIAKQNKIKCNQCNEEYQVKENEFKSSNELSKLIESKSHLSDEEISLKQNLEVSIRKFFELYDKFNQNKSKLESNVFDHFQEIRFQIDEQREELKKRIDDIALEMIGHTKISEELYLKTLKEKFSSFDDSQSLENELNQIEEMFRNPNLVIESIKKMQHKQEATLNDIQLKLKEMAKVKDDLKTKNHFKPNLSLFNQKEDTPLFGLIQLNGCWLSFHSFKGQILTNEQQCFELIELCKFSPNDKWSLLYRATRDGFGSSDFHTRCDGHSNTLTLLKAKESQFIFGGFTSAKWDSFSGDKADPNAFIFSLTNKDNKPVKMKIDPNKHRRAIYCHSNYGPSFGCDIFISNHANTTMKSRSYLGDTYSNLPYAFGTNKAKTFLAGTYILQLDEIEVFQRK